jgi:UDP-N-acetylmuramoylalanine-D-glutamate ligase
MFLLIDNELSTEKLNILSDHLNTYIVDITEYDKLKKNLPDNDIYIINISKTKLIYFYELNRDTENEIIYYKTKNILIDDSKICYDYLLKTFPTESKNKDELINKLQINNEIEKVSKFGSCCSFLCNKITMRSLCKSIFSCCTIAC